MFQHAVLRSRSCSCTSNRSPCKLLDQCLWGRRSSTGRTESPNVRHSDRVSMACDSKTRPQSCVPHAVSGMDVPMKPSLQRWHTRCEPLRKIMKQSVAVLQMQCFARCRPPHLTDKVALRMVVYKVVAAALRTCLIVFVPEGRCVHALAGRQRPVALCAILMPGRWLVIMPGRATGGGGGGGCVQVGRCYSFR